MFSHDWRAVPPDAWLERCEAQELYRAEFQPAQSPAELTVLSRPEFDDAVRSALRALHQPGELSANPLSRSRLVVEQDERDDAVEKLRELLIDAADSLAHDPHTAHLHRVVATKYFQGTLTQEAAAERLGVAFSTYRRHLARGVDRIANLLWEREVRGASWAASQSALGRSGCRGSAGRLALATLLVPVAGDRRAAAGARALACPFSVLPVSGW